MPMTWWWWFQWLFYARDHWNCRASQAVMDRAEIIVITPQDTPLAKIADILLPIKHMETDFIYKPSASRYAMLALVDVLSMGNGGQSQEPVRATNCVAWKVALDSYRGGKHWQPLVTKRYRNQASQLNQNWIWIKAPQYSPIESILRGFFSCGFGELLACVNWS